MKAKALLLAVALAGFATAGAAADGGPGPGGGHPPKPPPPPSQPGGSGQQPGSPGTSQPGEQRPGGPSASDRAFMQQLKTLGYKCLPRPVVLRGKLVSAGTDSLTLHTVRPNRPGQPGAPQGKDTSAGTDVSVKLIPATLIFRQGPATVADLVAGDAVEVGARACRAAGSATGSRPTLVARRVGARPARA